MVTGIVCEYNPFHLGHKKQLDAIRAADPEGSIVCLMSGNFVQRGVPAIIDKALRAKAAVKCGADLVLEMPVTVSLSSAEGFASGSVAILSGFCHQLCFGTESADITSLVSVARKLLTGEFALELQKQLKKGVSFPAARQAALESLGEDTSILQQPNNILAVEYCKAIIAQGSPMRPIPIRREGDYHSMEADEKNPSATFLRTQMLSGAHWHGYTTKEAAECFETAPLHSISAGERAILYRLRTMTDAEFESLPYGSEGLWRKLMHAARKESTLEEILTAVKSKRYTRTRLDRMVMCAFLGITKDMLNTQDAYARVLALNDRGRQIVKQARQSGFFPNAGEPAEHPYRQLEDRCDYLYGLFAVTNVEPPADSSEKRIYKD